jgi:cell volume regulation protein A
VTEAAAFGRIVLLVGAGLVLAIASSRVSARLRVPAPAVFLAAAAIASDAHTQLGTAITARDVERICVVALIVILFNGGMELGLDRFRESLWPILSLGLVGTIAVALIMAVAVHGVTGFGWLASLLVGAAVAPTDPAAVFSVLGGREIEGRSDHILKGESGVNDPVGIALVIGLLEIITSDGTWGSLAAGFALEMTVGLVVGIAGGLLIRRALAGFSLPDDALYPLLALAGAGVTYGLAAVLHGSGFLAVFVAGLIVSTAPSQLLAPVQHIGEVLASLGEIIVFVALGLTVDLGSLGFRSVIVDGVLIAVSLTFVARPVAVAVLLAGADLSRGERVFVAWAGMRGAVPILLAAVATVAGVGHAARIYGTVFVVVMFSVLVQGTLIEPVARRCGLEMHRSVRPSAPLP